MTGQLISYPILKSDSISEVYFYHNKTKLELPYFLCSVSAGIPSDVNDFIKEGLDLNEFLVSNPDSTFILKVSGDSMIGAGINNNDTLIVDKAIEPINGDVVIASIDGELTVKTLKVEKNNIYLVPENINYNIIEINQNSRFEILGVVISSVKKFRRR